MPCDTRRTRGQTIQQRAEEVRRVLDLVQAALVAGRVKARVGKQGAIAFEGISEVERDGVTDACIYRRLMVSGSALARAKIAQAEQLAGRTVDKQVIGHGTHSHDGGHTWHDHKG
jgi:hypothetical protein